MPLRAGEKLGPYEIVEPIGTGGMGEVYRAHDPRLGRDVALKASSDRFSERFEREARAGYGQRIGYEGPGTTRDSRQFGDILGKN